jgi:hypothetical protein
MNGKIAKFLRKVAYNSKFSEEDLKQEWKNTPRNLKPKLRKKYNEILNTKKEALIIPKIDQNVIDSIEVEKV